MSTQESAPNASLGRARYLVLAAGIINLLPGSFNLVSFIALHYWWSPLFAALSYSVAGFMFWRFACSQRSPISSSTLPSPSPSSSPGPSLSGSFPLPSLSAKPNPSLSLPEIEVDSPVIGFRVWSTSADGRALISNHSGGHWAVGITTADCSKPYYYSFGERAISCSFSPNPECQCGLYGLHDPPQMWMPLVMRDTIPVISSSGITRRATREEIEVMEAAEVASFGVLGAIAGWGKICRHGDEGFRAQYARVVALAISPRPPLESFRDHKRLTAWSSWLGRLNRLAEQYQVPIVLAENLKTYALEFGQTLKPEIAQTVA